MQAADRPILIVDDYVTMRRILRLLLRQLGRLEVDEASDGAAALAQLRRRDYGLILSDWNMQPMTGLELLRAVRAAPDLGCIPFVMLTGESVPTRIEAARSAGVDACLHKPFDAADLAATIAALAPRAGSA